jgi:hypothetical protein
VGGSEGAEEGHEEDGCDVSTGFGEENSCEGRTVGHDTTVNIGGEEGASGLGWEGARRGAGCGCRRVAWRADAEGRDVGEDCPCRRLGVRRASWLPEEEEEEVPVQ